MKIIITAITFTFFLSPLFCLSEQPQPNNIKFNVYRNDSLIGYHKVDFSSSENFLNADIEIKFEVKFLGFVVYEYFHKNKEVWNDSNLINLNTTTNKNGEFLKCKLTKTNGAFTIDGTLAKEVINESLVPTSYWNKILVHKKNPKVLNTQDCSYIKFKVTDLGKEKIYNNSLEASHYKLIGKEVSGEVVDIDIWYNQSKEWVKMIFVKDESKIEYFLNEYDSKE